MYSNRVSSARQEPFDAIPRSVQQRADLIGNPKRLYGALCSAQRTGWQPTYADLADHLGASARSIVRWVARLTELGLIAVRRRGQGLPNVLTVLALVTSGGATLARAALPNWRSSRARVNPAGKRSGERTGHCQTCGAARGQPHGDSACYTRGLPAR